MTTSNKLRVKTATVKVIGNGIVGVRTMRAFQYQGKLYATSDMRDMYELNMSKTRADIFTRSQHKVAIPQEMYKSYKDYCIANHIPMKVRR